MKPNLYWEGIMSFCMRSTWIFDFPDAAYFSFWDYPMYGNDNVPKR